MNEITVLAHVDQMEAVNNFIREELAPYNCSPKAEMQIELAIEEIFVNIAHYAYKPEGNATIRCGVDGALQQVTIQFLDDGIPYNPLEKDDPDVTLEADGRDIGGLGVFLVKRTMDDVDYQYLDRKNILTIKKSL